MRDKDNKYRFKKLIKLILINCHLYVEIENSKNGILHYESDDMVSTLRISLRRYSYKFGFLLSISAALCGVPCSIKYSFRENELIC